jgi:DNA-binding transcriptional regulator LsrR (DeoR family)
LETGSVISNDHAEIRRALALGRAAKSWRLSQLGWTQAEIGERLGGLDKATVSRELQNSQMGKMQQDLGEHWNDKGVACRMCH